MAAFRMAAIAMAAATAAWGQTVLSGRVVDDSDAPIAQARITVRNGTEPPLETYSGPTGAFRIVLPAPGNYLAGAIRTGYFELRAQPVQVEAGGSEITLVMNPQREVFQSVQVGELPDTVEPEQTSSRQSLSGTDVNNIPYPASNSLRNAMKLIPGVVQDPTGSLHFHGGGEYQTQYTLDGFDITNPIDGRYDTRLAVEGVRSLDLAAARETAPYGRGSAGTLAIQTDTGTDQLHYTATNFIPGLELRDGLRIGDWTPRAGVSGPIVRGRAWFSDSFDGDYNSGFFSGLPAGQNTNASWAAGNLLHAQVNTARGNILYGDFLGDFDHQAHLGLGPLDPTSTTSALTDRQWLASVKDSQAWGQGGEGDLLELGFAWQSIYRTQVPMGDAPYVLSPSGRSGNYFLDSRQEGRRDQLFVNFFPRARHVWGRHQLQLGADGQWLNYSARNQRSGFTVVGESGLPLYVTTFVGSGVFDESNFNAAGYINDHWQPSGTLAIDAGLRLDGDRLVGRAAVSPRVAISWAPFHNARTKLSAGYAVLRDATNLSLFSRPLDQQALTVAYNSAGVAQAPVLNSFAIGGELRFPRYDQYSVGAEHAFTHGLSAKLELMRKRGRDGFVYAPEGDAAQLPISVQPQLLGYGFGGQYALSNLRRDRYDEAAITLRQNLGDQYGWLAGYTRSRAVSNAVLDTANDQPFEVLNAFVPMPWDAPNRLLGWAYLPVPRLGKNWAVAVLADWRDGFPFSVTDAAGFVAGGPSTVDGSRYPSNFDLNVHIERRFVLRGYRFAIRLGANNLTGHRNPTAVNNVVGSPQFLQFYGDEGRHFVVRIRMFGHAAH